VVKSKEPTSERKETPKCKHCGHRVIEVDGELKHLKLLSNFGTTIQVSRVCTVRVAPRWKEECGCCRPEKREKKRL
jgi:hypothetical protein